MFEQSVWKMQASEKLRTMWKGQVVSMVSLIFLTVVLLMMLAVLVVSPYALMFGGGLGFTLFLTLGSAAAMLVGGILYLVGLYGLRDIQPEYRTAFVLELVHIVLSLLGGLAGEGSLFYRVVEVAGIVLSLVILWLVLQATNRIMGGLGREDMVQRGRNVWILNLVSTVASVLALMPSWLSGTAFYLVISLLLSILSLTAGIWYILYLGRAAEALKLSFFE